MIITDLKDLGRIRAIGATRHTAILRIQHIHVTEAVSRNRWLPFIIYLSLEAQACMWSKSIWRSQWDRCRLVGRRVDICSLYLSLADFGFPLEEFFIG